MKHSIALGLLAYVLCIGVSFAQCSADLSWTPPSQYTNGDPLDPATDLTEYRVYEGSTVVATPAPGTQGFRLEPVDYGAHEYAMTAVAVNGNESGMSVSTTFDCVDNRVPEPPSNFLAQLVAWLIDIWSRIFA